MVDDLAVGQHSPVIQHKPDDYDRGASVCEFLTLARFGHPLLDGLT
jgi:hypothetical protein